MKSLVVDDVRPNCRVMQAVLAKYGSCDAASNGRECVETFHKAWQDGAPYQAIFLDMVLPDMDGFKVLEVLRKIETAMKVATEQRAHVFFVSSHDPEAYVDKLQGLQYDGWITKPISLNTVTEKLRRSGLIE